MNGTFKILIKVSYKIQNLNSQLFSVLRAPARDFDVSELLHISHLSVFSNVAMSTDSEVEVLSVGRHGFRVFFFYFFFLFFSHTVNWRFVSYRKRLL